MVTRNQIIAASCIAAFLILLAVGAYFGRQITHGGVGESSEARELPRRIGSEFEVFDRAVLSEAGSGEEMAGHRFAFSDSVSARYMVQLYFVESPEPELNERTRESVAAMARYFGDVPLDKLLEGGVEARDFTARLLAENRFRIATKFESPESGPSMRASVRAFVLVEMPDGEERYLSEILVQEGYAAISVPGVFLPYGEPRDTYRAYLARLEEEARRAGRGIWAHSRSETAGGVDLDAAP